MTSSFVRRNSIIAIKEDTMRVTRRSVRTRSGIEALVLAIALAGCGTGPDSAGTVETESSSSDLSLRDPFFMPPIRAQVVAQGIPGAGAITQVGTFHRGSPIHDKATLNPSIAPGMVLDPARLLVASSSSFGATLSRPAEAPGARPFARRQPRSRHGGARSGDRRRTGGQRRRAGADLCQSGRRVPQQRQQSDGGDRRVAVVEPAARHLDQQRQRPPLDRQRPDRRERRGDDHGRRSQRRSAGRSAQSGRGRRLFRRRDQPQQRLDRGARSRRRGHRHPQQVARRDRQGGLPGRRGRRQHRPGPRPQGGRRAGAGRDVSSAHQRDGGRDAVDVARRRHAGRDGLQLGADARRLRERSAGQPDRGARPQRRRDPVRRRRASVPPLALVQSAGRSGAGGA